MLKIDFEKQFEYENNFYLTAPVNRISKFVTHLDLFKRVTDIRGEIVECGVFKGVSLSRFIKFRSLFGNAFSKRIIAFDTFGDFPAATYEQDKEKRDLFIAETGGKSISREQFVSILEELNLYQNIEFIEGDILKTVPAYLDKNPHLKISLLHIDVDLYEPTRQCLETLFPSVVKGGIIILDDYGAFAGANKAIDDFFSDIHIKISQLHYSNAISYVEVL